MYRIILMAVLGLGILNACGESKPKPAEEENNPIEEGRVSLEKEILALEKELSSLPVGTTNRDKSFELIAKSEAYAASFPDHPTAPAQLFRAADVALGLGEAQLAVQHWGKIQKQYPDYERAGDAYFMIGFTYETQFNNLEQARRFYQQFLIRYPDHRLTDQVEKSLANLNKSPEELIKEFKQKDPPKQ